MSHRYLIFKPDPKRIVVRGVNWLGDAVMTTPALARLRERFAKAHIALLSPDKFRDIWRHHPAINEVITVGPSPGVLATARILRSGTFDLAVILPNSPRSALECWFAGIPCRIGYARPWRNWFLTHAVPPRPGAVRMEKRSTADIRAKVGHRPPQTAVATRSAPLTETRSQTHQSFEYLHLIAALGAKPDPAPPRLFVTDDELKDAKSKFGLDAVSQPLYALNPGAEYGPAKRWPVERFADAARKLHEETGCLWLILGGPSDRLITGELATKLVAAGVTFRNVAGQTSLRDLAALLKLARVLVTNDTGPMHVAAALGTPVVAVFGSTSPELTGPGLSGGSHHQIVSSRAPCSPCFQRICPIDFRCMTTIPVDSVVEAARKAAQL